jgi:hypothetical protein
MTDRPTIQPLRIDLQVQTPHGQPIPGADVALLYGGTDHAAAAEAGTYEITLPRPGDYQLRIT